MSRIFFSYSRKNVLEAVALKEWLSRQDPSLEFDIFLDLDERTGIRLATKWRDALEKASARCEYVVCLYSPDWARSPECQRELDNADFAKKLIIPVRLVDEPIDDRIAKWQWVDLFGPGPQETVAFTHQGRAESVVFAEAGLRSLAKLFVNPGDGPETFDWPPPNEPGRSPYRGWEPLKEVDAAAFYGRDAEIAQSLGHVNRMRQTGKNLYVIRGQSGSGRSSFLQAGLVPRLWRRDRDFVVLGTVRAERNPLTGDLGLAESIRTVTAELGLPALNLADLKNDSLYTPHRIDQHLEKIHEAATARLLYVPEDQRPPTLVLPIDEAEELFGHDADGEADRFLELVARYMRDGVAERLPMIVVMTMRTDEFALLERAEAFRGLERLVFDLRPVAPADFAAVITGPARLPSATGQALKIEPQLVDRLLADSRSGADTLPLLSLTLARLWAEYGSDGDLRLDEYQSMGGMGVVVQKEVDALLAKDPDAKARELELLRTTFIPRLATVNPQTGDPERGVAARGDLPADAQPLLDRFVKRRMLVAGPGDTLEVASERLLDDWQQLRGWLDDVRSDLTQAELLKRRSAEWQQDPSDNSLLLGDKQLGEADRLLNSPFAEYVSPAGDYVDASRKHVSEQRRRRRIQRAVAVVAVVVAVLATVAVYQWRQSSRLARALELVTQSEQMLDGGMPGGDVRAMQQLLAAKDLGVTNVEGVAAKRSDLVRIMQLPGAGDGKGVVDVNGIAVSPDGKLVAAATGDHRVRIWHTDTGKSATSLEMEGRGAMQAVAFSGQGNLIAAGGDDGLLRLWNAGTGVARPVSGPPGGIITSVAFSTSGGIVAAGTSDGFLRRWDTQSGTELPERLIVPERRAVRSLSFKPDPKTVGPQDGQLIARDDQIVTGDDYGRVQLWDGRSGTPRSAAKVVAKGPSVMAIAFGVVVDEHGPRYRIAAGMSDGSIHVLNGELQEEGAVIAAHPGIVQSVAFSPGGTRIVSGGSDNTVRVWDALTDTPIGDPLVGHHGVVSSVVFSPETTQIISGGLDGSVRIWNAVSGLPIPARQGAEVRSVAFRPTGVGSGEREMASGGTDGTVKLWNADTGAPIKQLGDVYGNDYEHSINTLAFSPAGDRLVTGSYDGELRLWDLSVLPEGQPVASFDSEVANRHLGARISSVAFSPDGLTIATGQWDGTIQLWNALNLEPTSRPANAQYQVWNVAFSPTGNYLASGSGAGLTPNSPNVHEIKFWGAQDLGNEPPEMTGTAGSVIYSLSFNEKGDVIASGSGDGTIQLWDVGARKPLGPPLRGDQNAVMSVAFAHRGSLMASGTADGKVRLWDTAAGRPIGTPIQGHRKWVHSVAFSPDDRWIVSGGADGNLRLWPVIQNVDEAICSKLNANMSEADWQRYVAGDWLMSWVATPYQELCRGLPAAG